MDPERLRRTLEVAGRQHGHLTREDLVAAGWSKHAVGAARASGLIVPAGRQTFRLGSEPPTWRGRVAAATLDTGGVASHRTAAALHGLADKGETIEVTISRQTGRRPGSTGLAGGVLVHSSTNLPAEDVLLVHDIPTTSVARTILGLAALVDLGISPAELRTTVEVSLDRELATMPWLWWLLEQRRCRGRDGVRAMEEVLALLDGLAPTESWLERRALAILAEGGLPRPETQRVVRRSGRFVARVDFLYELQRLVIEVLGYRFHRTRQQMDADARRVNELQLLGFDVLQFTYDTVVRHPGRMVADVRRGLGC